jgi:glycosyltransferase involved in cell wall biosynthesis
MTKPRILVLVAYYLPGFRSGGPLQSISSLVEALGEELDFSIVTSDRDKGDVSAYPGITPGRWTAVGKGRVLYLPEKSLGGSALFRILESEKADVLYVNSFFASRFSILPLLARAWGARGQGTVVLAPRGEFSPSALKIRPFRKQAYIGLAKRLGIYRDVIWHASSTYEEADIRRIFGEGSTVRVALPLSSPDTAPPVARAVKTPGSLKVAFLSRIVPKKNLVGALRMIAAVSGNVEFNIFGPAEDAVYWRECEAEMEKLPGNVKVRFLSEIRHEKVGETLGDHHVFLFPTLGENYGHVIHEALSAGCIAVISDRTPWRGLQQNGAGWDLSLAKPELFVSALERCIAMTDLEFRRASVNAREFVRKFSGGVGIVADNRALFECPRIGITS